jgi:hypothetical protein
LERYYSLILMLTVQHAFEIPYHPRVDLAPSQVGWSIWSFTALDWHLLHTLPAHPWLRRYRCASETAEAEGLLAECGVGGGKDCDYNGYCGDCEWAERWGDE